MKSYRPSSQATRANPCAFSWLGSMYSGQVSLLSNNIRQMVKGCHLICNKLNTHQLSQCCQSCNLIFPSVNHGKKLGTDIFDFNGRKYLMIVYYYRNFVIDKLTCEIMENKPSAWVPDVVFMNFMSGMFSSKTLVSM